MRVAENLGLALREVLDRHSDLYLLGEDIVDPYGGAFGITRGLSSAFPGRVLATPLSEGAIVGMAAGLALAGDKAIVEIMFGDFATLAFDQIVNFASKSVSMYGRRVALPLVVRCPVGGGRGYGPTHSQSLQKHFIGVPGLSLYEMSPLHDNRRVLPRILAAATPAMFFENKLLYTHQMVADGVVDDMFSYDFCDPGTARVFVDDPTSYDCVILAAGGLVHRALAAMRSLLLDEDITCLLLVPSRLYPFDVDPLLPILRRAELICVVEESTAGGTWGAEVAHVVGRALWATLRHPVTLVHSADSVIPTARHLEQQVLVQDRTIHQAVLDALRSPGRVS